MFSKSVFLTIAVSAVAASSAFSTIHTVDNVVANNADFTSLQAAHDGAASGDTLYVYGSAPNYGGLTLTKTLFILGPGYFLTSNPMTQAKPLSAKITGAIIFNAGAEGSFLLGLDLDIELALDASISINTNNIIVKRNRIGGGALAWIGIADNLSNIIITQNYMTGAFQGIVIGNDCQNIIITNNYLDACDDRVLVCPISSSSTAKNNVIIGRVQINNSIFYNNIGWADLGPEVDCPGSFPNNNSNSNDVQNNIRWTNVDMSTVFVGGSTDGRWQLAPGSPAIGAGINGEDVGMFGGDDAYVLSGLPAIPAIYFFNAPLSGSSSQGLPVHVKIKSHN